MVNLTRSGFGGSAGIMTAKEFGFNQSNFETTL
jgi:hypothetical protein